MTRQEIAAFFPKFSPAFFEFGGMNYAVPDLAWLQGPFYAFFRRWLWSEGDSTWRVKWQCRDFSRAFATFAQVSNALTASTPDGDDAVAVGEFWFHPDGNPPGQNHAINACITDQGLIFIEPQTGQVRAMSANEILSCTFVRF